MFVNNVYVYKQVENRIAKALQHGLGPDLNPILHLRSILASDLISNRFDFHLSVDCKDLYDRFVRITQRIG